MHGLIVKYYVFSRGVARNFQRGAVLSHQKQGSGDMAPATKQFSMLYWIFYEYSTQGQKRQTSLNICKWYKNPWVHQYKNEFISDVRWWILNTIDYHDNSVMIDSHDIVKQKNNFACYITVLMDSRSVQSLIG